MGIFEGWFGGPKVEEEHFDSAGHVAVPGETGETLSDAEVGDLDFSKQIIRLQEEVNVLKNKDNPTEEEKERVRFLSERIDNIKDSITPKSY